MIAPRLTDAERARSHRCLVVGVREVPQKHGSTANRVRLCQASLAHEREDAILGVVSQLVARVKPAREKAARTGLRPAEIQQVKGAAGFEDAPDLPQCLALLVLPEVVEQEGREDSVE